MSRTVAQWCPTARGRPHLVIFPGPGSATHVPRQNGRVALPESLDVLRTRRTVHSYTAEPVSRQGIQELIDGAILAPSGMDFQPWAFTVVTSREVLTKVNAIVVGILRGGRHHLPRRQPGCPALEVLHPVHHHVEAHRGLAIGGRGHHDEPAVRGDVVRGKPWRYWALIEIPFE